MDKEWPKKNDVEKNYESLRISPHKLDGLCIKNILREKWLKTKKSVEIYMIVENYDT